MKPILKEIYRHSKNKDIFKLFWRSQGSMFTRESLAIDANINCPFFILLKLAKDESVFVRNFLADNINIPLNILKELEKDKSNWIRTAVFNNPTYKKYVKYKILTRIKNWWGKENL